MTTKITETIEITSDRSKRRRPARAVVVESSSKIQRLTRAVNGGKALIAAIFLIAAWAVVVPATATYNSLVARVKALEDTRLKLTLNTTGAGYEKEIRLGTRLTRR